MLNGKSWAILAAVAAVAVGGIAKAESVSAAAEELSLSSKPLALQAGTTPSRRPLMAGLDAIGLARPLEDAGINIGGYAAASVTYYADPIQGSDVQPGRLFDTENQDPTINQIGLFVERTVDVTKGNFDLGGRVEVIWGSDARFIHATGLFDHYGNGDPRDFDSPDNQFDPVQAYVDAAIPVGNGLRLRVGKFVTPAGYETINPTTTPLYSRGLLFTYLLPFTHTGVLGTYALNDQWSFDAGIVRGWDDALEDKNDDGVTFLARASYTFADKKQALYTTVTVGPEFPADNTTTRSLIDLVYTVKYSDQTTFALQGDLLWETDVDGRTFGDADGNAFNTGDDDGFAAGIGGWASHTYSQFVQINGRLEYLYDGQGFRFPPEVTPNGNINGNNVYSATLGLTITPFPTDNIGSNLKIRPELRYDYADKAVFGGDNNQLTFALEGYFTF